MTRTDGQGNWGHQVRHARWDGDQGEPAQRPRAARLAERRDDARIARLGRRATAASLVLMTGLVGAGVAVAYVASTATRAATASVVAPSITAEAAPVAGLYPGATGSLLVTVVNAGRMPFIVTSVTADPAEADGCPGDNLQPGIPTSYPTVTAGGTSTVTIPVTMPIGAPNGCQGAVFTVPVHVSGTAG